MRNHYELTRKDLVVKNLKRLRRELERDKSKDGAARCDFLPTSFVLPNEYRMFVEEFKANPNTTYIMKPARGLRLWAWADVDRSAARKARASSSSTSCRRLSTGSPRRLWYRPVRTACTAGMADDHGQG